jgi:glycerophosphoryl diester phosphodiesterase
MLMILPINVIIMVGGANMWKVITFTIALWLFSTSTALVEQSISLTADDLTLKINERYNININNKVKGSKYYWTSTNTNVATVNPKNGVVKAVGGGITDINCKIILPSGKIQKLNCRVEIIPPFFENKYMAHAGGGYEGNIYSNTEEAIRSSIDNGYKFIEVDMTLTSDDKLVCSHGWDKNTCEATGIEYTDGKAPTYDEFMSWRIHGKYGTIDASTVIEIMKEYPDLLVEIDLKKFGKARTKRAVTQLVELADYDEQILDRILMQFTSETAYFAIKEIYDFKYYQYFTYKSRIADELEDVIKFCKDNKIVSIAVNYTVLTDDMIDRIKDNNLYLLAFTIDDEDLAQEFLDRGVDTICTNFIQ